MNGLEKEYRDRVTFVNVNILNPDSQLLMDQYGFTTAPEIYLLDSEGTVVAVWDDQVTADTMRQALDDVISRINHTRETQTRKRE